MCWCNVSCACCFQARRPQGCSILASNVGVGVKNVFSGACVHTTRILGSRRERFIAPVEEPQRALLAKDLRQLRTTKPRLGNPVPRQ